MCKAILFVSFLISFVSPIQAAWAADSPKSICRIVGAWDADKGVECGQAVKKCDSYDSNAIRICKSMVYWDFKYVPDCLRAVCNSTFTESEVKGCEAQAIFDYQAAVSCLESTGN